MGHVLHCGDCLDPVSGLPSLADKSVDHTICDPPYSKIVVTSAKRSRMSDEKNRRHGSVATTRSLGYVGISVEQRAAVAAEIARVTKRWALIFTDAESLSTWRVALEASGMRHMRMGAWVAPNCTPQFTGDRPGTGWEACEIAHGPGRSWWNGGGYPAVWIFPRPANGTADREATEHPTPKPLELMERLIADFTDPGELILDPFAGSATTGAACKRLGRRFVGWEINEKFHAAAVRRIDAAREQFQLPRIAKPRQVALALPEEKEPAA